MLAIMPSVQSQEGVEEIPCFNGGKKYFTWQVRPNKFNVEGDNSASFRSRPLVEKGAVVRRVFTHMQKLRLVNVIELPKVAGTLFRSAPGGISEEG